MSAQYKNKAALSKDLNDMSGLTMNAQQKKDYDSMNNKMLADLEKNDKSKMPKFAGMCHSKMRGGYLDVCLCMSSTSSKDAAAPWIRAYPFSPAAACSMRVVRLGHEKATRHTWPELHNRRIPPPFSRVLEATW